MKHHIKIEISIKSDVEITQTSEYICTKLDNRVGVFFNNALVMLAKPEIVDSIIESCIPYIDSPITGNKYIKIANYENTMYKVTVFMK